jgi:hypothetical protein
VLNGKAITQLDVNFAFKSDVSETVRVEDMLSKAPVLGGPVALTAMRQVLYVIMVVM